MLWLFRQNNSGGHFTQDSLVTVQVVIEAATPEEANTYATDNLGIYFNGVDSELDCECCGDRWYPVKFKVEDEQHTFCSKYSYETYVYLKDRKIVLGDDPKCLRLTKKAKPFRYPDVVPRLAEALSEGTDCAFALQDALLEEGLLFEVQHLQDCKAKKKCRVLQMLVKAKI